MAFNWADYLTVAREAAGRNEEAFLRSAISRAYYAALGKARVFLEQEGHAFPVDATLHSQVWQEFKDSAEGIRYYIGVDGLWLRRNRNTADYSDVATDLPVRAQQAMKKAESILRSLDRLAAPPPASSGPTTPPVS